MKKEMPENLSEAAWRAMDQNNYEKAIRIYGKLIRLQPSCARSYALRGYCRSKMNDFGHALTDYSKALSLRPSAPTTLYQRARIYEQMERYEEALEDYRKSCALSPEWDAFRNMGTIHHFRREWEEARRCYRRALFLKPDAEHVRKLLRMLMRKIRRDSGLRLEAPAMDFPADAETILRSAARDVAGGDCETARMLYDTLLERFPESAAVHFLRGCCCFTMADYEAALRDFTEAASLLPDHASSWFNRAKALAALKRHAEAIRVLRKCGELENRYDVRLFLGRIREELFEFEKARRAYRDAMEMNPSCREARSAMKKLMRRILFCSGLRRERIRSETCSAETMAHLEEAEDLIRHGECETALALYDSLAETLKQAPWYFSLRGRCRFFMADYRNALREFSAELTCGENNPDALFNRALAQASIGNFQSALKDLEKSKKLRFKKDIPVHEKIIFEWQSTCSHRGFRLRRGACAAGPHRD